MRNLRREHQRRAFLCNVVGGGGLIQKRETNPASHVLCASRSALIYLGPHVFPCMPELKRAVCDANPIFLGAYIYVGPHFRSVCFAEAESMATAYPVANNLCAAAICKVVHVPARDYPTGGLLSLS